MKIQIIGNCQAEAYSETINIIGIGVKSEYVRIEAVTDSYQPDFETYDYVISQAHSRLSNLNERVRHDRFILAPTLTFLGYHPDLIFLTPAADKPAPRAQSNIIVNAYLSGLSEEECSQLFCDRFISKLDYAVRFDAAQRQFVDHLNKLGLDGEFLFSKWRLKAPFMMLPEHPEIWVTEDIARHLCTRIGARARPIALDTFTVNRMKLGTIFPTYQGHVNALTSRDQHYRFDGVVYALDEFIHRSYTALRPEFEGDAPAEALSRLPAGRHATFQAALEAFSAPVGEATAANPYSSQPDAAFWRKSVSSVPADQVAPVAPVTSPLPVIEAGTRVATAGSCFAQHIAKTLSAQGLNYYVAETPPAAMPREEAQAKGYGLFSARYGNIYTARQLLQLARRAYGQFSPEETHWPSKTGRYLDPFRPNLGEDFATLEALIASREAHFASVRTMLESLDLFVFTLGLTEAWTNTHDGSVYPVAPGVVSQHNSYETYAFRNFSKDDIVDDMTAFLSLLRSVNPSAQVLMTVSPVPLIATYTDEHALSATTYSKSVLRTAAQELANGFGFASYFPSYEIITGSYNRGVYFEDDFRTIRQEGVDHVMRVLTETLVAGAAGAPRPPSQTPLQTPTDQNIQREIDAANSIVCDEDLIESNP